MSALRLAATGLRRARVFASAPPFSRSATSLPQIPGVILTNKEVADDRLVRWIRRWVDASAASHSGTFDLLQLADSTEGQPLPRAICCLLRTQVQLADNEEPVKALVTVFYRARDFLNQEFWADQIRRLSDILADEYLSGGRGVHLMVHQNAPKFSMGLEIGDHRLLAEFEALNILGSPWRRRGGPVAELAESVTPHQGFHRLLTSPQPALVREAKGPEVRRGHYVLRDEAGAATCGVEVLSVLPSRLVCGAAWAAEGFEGDFGKLVDALRRQAGKSLCSLLADPRDAGWQRLCGATAAPLPGLWRSRKRLGVAITGVPVGLTPEEQVRLAKAPFLVPWEFVPFHLGRFMLI